MGNSARLMCPVLLYFPQISPEGAVVLGGPWPLISGGKEGAVRRTGIYLHILLSCVWELLDLWARIPHVVTKEKMYYETVHMDLHKSYQDFFGRVKTDITKFYPFSWILMVNFRRPIKSTEIFVSVAIELCKYVEHCKNIENVHTKTKKNRRQCFSF